MKRERAKRLLSDLHALYGGAGTFTTEQLDAYATELIEAAMRREAWGELKHERETITQLKRELLLARANAEAAASVLLELQQENVALRAQVGKCRETNSR